MERELFIRDADSEDAKKLVETYSYYLTDGMICYGCRKNYSKRSEDL